MLASVVLTLAAIAAGTLATFLYDDEMPLVARLSLGTVSGLAAAALVAFVLANLVGVPTATALLAALLAGLLVIGIFGAVRRPAATGAAGRIGRLAQSVSSPTLPAVAASLYALGLGIVVWLAFERVMIVEPDGISTGYVNNLGDLPFHTHLSASFAFSGNLPPFDPTYAGSGLAYPYMADFLSAVYLVLGAPMDGALFLLNVSLGLALLGAAHWFTRLVTRDALAALIAPALILFSGGLGWLVMIDQLRASEQGLIGFLGALPQDYTIGNSPIYRWGNAVTTLFATQRSMLFGVPVALAIFGLLWRLIAEPAEPIDGLSPRSVAATIRRHPGALAAGLLTGMLPLIHAHSFIVVLGTAFMLGVLFRQWRDGKWLAWAIYVVAALAIAVPEVLWSTRGSLANAGTFFGIEIGWDRGELDPVTFWVLNTGLFIPLVVFGLLAPRLRERMPAGLVLFSLPFLAWFVVPNVVKLAPWVWDNIKVLFYWYVGFVPLVALLIAWLLRDRLVLRGIGAVILATLVLAGSLDVWRVVSRQTAYGEFDSDGVAFASRILDHTAERATMLHAPTWNTPAYLTGRQSLLGYPGHMWSRGLEYAGREADIRHIYTGGPDASELMLRHGIDYVIVGPHEHALGAVNTEFFSQFMEVAAAGEYRLYQITP